MRWIAVDWGTTRLRATRMGGDAPAETRDSGDGMGTLSHDGFELALRALVPDWLPAPILAAGMVGSRQGWQEAPYRAVPCAPLGAPVPVKGTALDVSILPGLSQAAPHPDVMRGEEVQVAGVLAARPGFDGVVVLPGTHTKWVHLGAGEVVSFLTVMSGELFALLSETSVLRHSIASEGWDDAAFAAAVSDALSRPEALVARLFRLRAADLLHGQDKAVARATLSGLLLGAELAAARPWWLGRDAVVCGSDRTTPAYVAALAAQGVTAQALSANDATIAGMRTAWHDR